MLRYLMQQVACSVLRLCLFRLLRLQELKTKAPEAKKSQSEYSKMTSNLDKYEAQVEAAQQQLDALAYDEASTPALEAQAAANKQKLDAVRETVEGCVHTCAHYHHPCQTHICNATKSLQSSWHRCQLSRNQCLTSPCVSPTVQPSSPPEPAAVLLQRPHTRV